MNLQELRINNYVQIFGHIEIVTGVIPYGVYHKEGYTPNEKDWIKPIELTEEWLLKFGFKMEKGADYFYCIKTKMKNVTLEVNVDCRVILFDSKKQVFTDIKYTKYVHQLQNLYFALTGEELTIKE